MKIICVLLLFFLFTPQLVHANTFDLELSPDNTQLQLNPGSSESIDFTLTNTSQEETMFTVDLFKIEPNKNGDGGMQLSSGKSLKTTMPALAQRFKITQNGNEISRLTLSSGDTKTVTLEITIPENAIHEDIYTSLIFSGQPQEDMGVNIVGAVAGNILMTVGEPTPALSISKFDTEAFYWHGPIILSLAAKNTGNSLATAEGMVTIKNMFGKNVAELKIDETTILAQSNRMLSSEGSQKITWSPGLAFGLYTATAELSGGDNVQSHITFIILPIIPLTIIIICLVFCIGIYLRVRKKLS